MAKTKQYNITVNTGALLGNFLAEIQNLLDIVTVVYAGLESVTQAQYEEHFSFFSMYPALSRKLPLEEAKEKSGPWLVSSFLKEGVDATGNFLEDCRRICALYRFAGQGQTADEDLNTILDYERNQFNRLGFPDKMKNLRNEFSVATTYEEQLLALNAARNCLVHRKGIVSTRDTNDIGKLVVKWRCLQLSAHSPDKAQEIPVEAPMRIEAGWSIGIRFQDRCREFEIGQRITLRPVELHQCILTLSVFATEIVKSIESYGVTQGVIKDLDIPAGEGTGGRPLA